MKKQKTTNNLIFLTNELQNPHIYDEVLHLPLQFICHGICNGKMYRHLRNKSNFIVATDEITRRNENIITYGSLFLCPEWQFYAGILDSYQVCSLTLLGRNHDYDYQHRRETEMTPIYFDSIEELATLRYREGNPIQVETYFGNTKHPKILLRMTDNRTSHRIRDNIDAENFKELWRIQNGCT